MALLSELAAMLVFVAVTLYKELTTKSGSVEIPARIPSLAVGISGRGSGNDEMESRRTLTISEMD